MSMVYVSSKDSVHIFLEVEPTICGSCFEFEHDVHVGILKGQCAYNFVGGARNLR